MKKHMILAAIAATALCTSCSNEDDFSSQEATPVSFTINNEVITRTTTTAGENEAYTTSFTADKDDIGIYAVIDGTTNKNVKYHYNTGSQLQTADGDITVNYGQTANIYAYSPYQESQETDGSIVFSVLTDQSTADNFNASNFLTSTGTATYSKTNNPEVNLTFTPRLALVRVKLSNAIGITATKIWLKASPKVTWNYANDRLTVDTKTDNIIMFHQNSGESNATEQIFTAFVPAQTIMDDTQFLTIATPNDGAYVLKPGRGFSLTGGSINKISLTIGDESTKTLNAQISTVTPWGETDLTDISGDLSAEATPTVLISAEEGKIESTTTINEATAIGNITKTGWYKFISTSMTTKAAIEFDTDAMKLSTTESSNEWTNRGLCYRVDESRIQSSISKKFKLTLKAKSNKNDTNAKLRIAVFENATTNKYFSIGGNNTSVFPVSIPIDTYKDLSYIVDFGTYGTWTNSAWALSTPTYKNVYIYISASTAGTAESPIYFWVNDLTMTEVFE